MPISQLDPATRAAMLEPPKDRVSVIIDTDTANEIDDQFAIAWAILSPDAIDVKAVIAEPFSFAHHQERLLRAEAVIASDDAPAAQDSDEVILENYAVWARRLRDVGTSVSDLRFNTPEEGMELSFAEIERVYDAAGVDGSELIFRGADRYMVDATTPVESEGVDRIIALAREATEPLYIAAIGCITNVASALLLAPDIADKIVVLWTSGYPSTDERSNEPSLNLVQDVHATRVVFDSGAPLVYMPGYLIGQQLSLSQPEVHSWVAGTGQLGDLLGDLYDNNPLHKMFGIDGHFGRSWVIWDLICLAWLIDPALVPTTLRPTPALDDELFWDHSDRDTRPVMREAIGVDRDGIFRDLFAKLASS